MEPGHIPDIGHGMTVQGAWTPGAPVVRKYIGGIKYNQDALVPIIAYRCPRCGLLELYAEGQG
jgi:hypothetical protein